MATVLIQSLLLASSGLLSVGSITLVTLLLISDRGWRNGLGYALGYFSAYTTIGTSAVLLGYRAAENGTREPSRIFPMLLLFFGSLLFWMAFRNWRKPVAEKQKEPRFFSIVDKITPAKAFSFGAMVAVINLKNMGLFLSALSVVIFSPLLIPQKVIIALSVAFVFCLSVIIPVFIYVSFPRRAKQVLGGIKHILETHSRPIGIWLPLIFGCIFLIRGITLLL